MIQGARLAALLPHAGAMVLLDGVSGWGAGWLRAHSRSHLWPSNPLRREGRLGAVCAVEYAVQAAALHGALRAGAPQPPALLARLRGLVLHRDRLDDPALGLLRIEARLEHEEAGGLCYALAVRGMRGPTVLEAQAVIARRPG